MRVRPVDDEDASMIEVERPQYVPDTHEGPRSIVLSHHADAPPGYDEKTDFPIQRGPLGNRAVHLNENAAKYTPQPDVADGTVADGEVAAVLDTSAIPPTASSSAEAAQPSLATSSSVGAAPTKASKVKVPISPVTNDELYQLSLWGHSQTMFTAMILVRFDKLY